MQPGPTQVDPRVVQAMCGPPVHHLSHQFIDLTDRVCAQLAAITAAEGEVVILPSSGRGGIESVFRSVDWAGRAIVLATNGSFGRMMAAICRSTGANLVEVQFPDGEQIDVDAVATAVDAHDTAMLGVVHCESSTGMLNDIDVLSRVAKDAGALFLVDAVSSLGGVPISAADTGIDFCVSATQKALGAVAGLSLVAVSPRAAAAILDRPHGDQTGYFDLRKWWDIWLPEDRGGRLLATTRRFPFTMPSHLMMAMSVACDLITEEETLGERLDRHSRAMLGFRAGAKALGCDLLCGPASASPTITAISSVPGVTGGQLVTALDADHQISVAGGMDSLAGRLVRVGHMSESARPGPLVATLCAIASVTGQSAGGAVDAFNSEWNRRRTGTPMAG